MSRSNTKEFIEKSKRVHDDKFDYSLTEYVKSNINVKIICKIHGIFDQLPNNHLRKYGCYKCSGKYQLTTDDFIKKAKIIHNSFYKYDNVNYINMKIKVNIECPKHGMFNQKPSNHLQGLGCKKCGGNHIPNNEEFIEKANKVHNSLYKYNNINYKNSSTKIEIECSKHGIFKQTPGKHLSGHGCLLCGGSVKLTTEEFIEKANSVHNGLYSYDNVDYINNNTNVNIICNKHGLFKQQPGNHLEGKGCSKCNSSKGEIKILNILTNNKINFRTQYYFKDLKYKAYLKFDFGVFDENNNLKYLIEFNGKQHYEFVEFIHKNKKNYKVSLLRDKLKLEYCEKNNIELFIIRYDENIEDKMNEFIYKI